MISLIRSAKGALIAALALGVPGLASANYWNSDDGDTGAYLEAGYEYSILDDVDRKLGGSSTGSISLEDAHGARLQAGYDWGKVRLDFRLSAAFGDDTDSSVKNGYGTTTLNLYWDIYRYGFYKNNIVDLAVTPFVGVGAGGAYVFMQEDDSGTSTDGRGGFEFMGGPGGQVAAGVMFNITESLGLTMEYDWQYFNLLGDEGNLSNHILEAGLRWTF